MTFKKLLAVMVLLSVILGVDAKKNRSPRKTEKLYRKAGKWQRKLRDVWALLGVKPFLVQPGEEGDECVLTSKITVDDAADKGDYMLKSTVETDYVLKGAAVFTKAELDAAKGEVCADAGGTWDGAACTSGFAAAIRVLKETGSFDEGAGSFKKSFDEQAELVAAMGEGCAATGGTWDGALCTHGWPPRADAWVFPAVLAWMGIHDDYYLPCNNMGYYSHLCDPAGQCRVGG